MTKPTKWHVRPAKTQISLGIFPVWSEPSLCAQWEAKNPRFLHADSRDPDQTGRMSRLIWVLAGCTCHFVGFVMRRPIWRDQYCKNLKNLDTIKFAVITLRFEQGGFTIYVMGPEDTDGIANNRPWSNYSSRISLIWVSTVWPDVSVWKLRNITVVSLIQQGVQ